MDYRSKSDIVTAAIREMIFTGEIESGAPLRQRDLAKRFGVSPTPVREALRRLESEGLVHYDLHRGATVIGGSFGASLENFQIRSALEALAARIAADRISDEQLRQLRELQAEMAATDSREARSALNRRFHFLIYEAARSPMLLALLRLLWQALPMGPQVTRPPGESDAQHEAILDALERHDADEAERLVREHILDAAQFIIDEVRPPASSAPRRRAAIPA